ERMRSEWRASRAGHYRDNPKSPALFEHEYAVALKPEAWKAVSHNVANCLRHFFGLPLLGQIRATTPQPWSVEHRFNGFQFYGHSVWVAPDFGSGTEDGRLALVDWKAGGGRGEGASFQLGCYALYAHEVLGVSPGQTALIEVNLREPTVTTHRWDDDRLE